MSSSATQNIVLIHRILRFVNFASGHPDAYNISHTRDNGLRRLVSLCHVTSSWSEAIRDNLQFGAAVVNSNSSLVAATTSPRCVNDYITEMITRVLPLNIAWLVALYCEALRMELGQRNSAALVCEVTDKATGGRTSVLHQVMKFGERLDMRPKNERPSSLSFASSSTAELSDRDRQRLAALEYLLQFAGTETVVVFRNRDSVTQTAFETGLAYGAPLDAFRIYLRAMKHAHLLRREIINCLNFAPTMRRPDVLELLLLEFPDKLSRAPLDFCVTMLPPVPNNDRDNDSDDGKGILHHIFRVAIAVHSRQAMDAVARFVRVPGAVAETGDFEEVDYSSSSSDAQESDDDNDDDDEDTTRTATAPKRTARQNFFDRHLAEALTANVYRPDDEEEERFLAYLVDLLHLSLGASWSRSLHPVHFSWTDADLVRVLCECHVGMFHHICDSHPDFAAALRSQPPTTTRHLVSVLLASRRIGRLKAINEHVAPIVQLLAISDEERRSTAAFAEMTDPEMEDHTNPFFVLERGTPDRAVPSHLRHLEYEMLSVAEALEFLFRSTETEGAATATATTTSSNNVVSMSDLFRRTATYKENFFHRLLGLFRRADNTTRMRSRIPCDIFGVIDYHVPAAVVKEMLNHKNKSGYTPLTMLGMMAEYQQVVPLFLSFHDEFTKRAA